MSRMFIGLFMIFLTHQVFAYDDCSAYRCIAVPDRPYPGETRFFGIWGDRFTAAKTALTACAEVYPPHIYKFNCKVTSCQRAIYKCQ